MANEFDYMKSSVHVHSTLCDGRNTLSEMAVAAWQEGVTTLGFTGHSHTPCDLEYCMSPSRTAQYKGEVNRLKTQYKGKMEVLCGLEFDLFSDDDPTAYDYFIGSVHYLHGAKTDSYYEIDWRPQDLARCIEQDFAGDGLAAVEAYFANVAQVAARKPTILGHFDLIKKLNSKGDFFDESAPRYKAAAQNALESAVVHCPVLEVNTGGVYRGFREDFFPAGEWLGVWRELGGKAVITADSHNVKSILWGYDRAAQALRTAGYKSVQVLTAGGFGECEL